MAAIIVVNWEGAADTIACLDSLVSVPGPHRVYVVDNGSRDDSVARIRSTHPEAVVLELGGNRGYAAAFNAGRARALEDGAASLLLLNNDTIVAPDALDELTAAAAQHGPGIYSPKILRCDRPEELWYVGGYLDPEFKAHHIGRGEIDRGQYDDLRRVAWASGCALFATGEVAQRVGAMHEAYFLYLEDVDWCLQARARAVPTYVVPRACVYHGVSRSVRRLDPRAVRYYAWRNHYLLVARHGGRWDRLRARVDLASRFAKLALRTAYYPSYRRNGLYQARTRGLIDYVRGRFGPAPAFPGVMA